MISSCSGKSQEKISCKENLKECLIEFLISQNEVFDEKVEESLFLVNLNDMDGGNIHKKRVKDIEPGIYSFGILGPHFNNYLVLIGSEINLVENYEIEHVLQNLSNFFEKNPQLYSDEEKIRVTSNILKLLSNRELNEKLQEEVPDIELNEN
jgi:hypothetical protein